MTTEEKIKMAKNLTIEDFYFDSEIKALNPQLKNLNEDQISGFELIKANQLKLGNKSWNVSETVAECWHGLRASVARHYALQGYWIYTGKCYKKDGRKGDIVIKLI